MAMGPSNWMRNATMPTISMTMVAAMIAGSKSLPANYHVLVPRLPAPKAPFINVLGDAASLMLFDKQW